MDNREQNAGSANAEEDQGFPKNYLNHIFAPWRIAYFENPPPSSDFLTEAAQSTDDPAHLVICRGKSVFLMMNRYPYTSGHLMVVPYRKVADLSDLLPEEKLELLEMAQEAQARLKKVVRAHGFNIGINLGSCAGAGVPDHLHLHIVPRWNNDTNFLPVLTGVRIISEALDELYWKLVNAGDSKLKSAS